MSSPHAHAPRIVWHDTTNEAAWVAGIVAAVAEAIAQSLAGAERTMLLLSGGSTPAPVYRALGATALDWSRVVVSLVDERDVAADAPASNARLVRETLLVGAASAATFWPLREPAITLDECVAWANTRWRTAALPVAAALLGMGDDGHTASLFPGSVDLERALAAPEPYVAIDARGCAGAGEWPRRISLTPAGLAAAETRLLLLRGERKRARFDAALTQDLHAAPIRAAMDAKGAPLAVHACAC